MDPPEAQLRGGPSRETLAWVERSVGPGASVTAVRCRRGGTAAARQANRPAERRRAIDAFVAAAVARA